VDLRNAAHSRDVRLSEAHESAEALKLGRLATGELATDHGR
jgi:hypothetical protein